MRFPPSGIASRALTTRFISTCSTCPASAKIPRDRELDVLAEQTPEHLGDALDDLIWRSLRTRPERRGCEGVLCQWFGLKGQPFDDDLYVMNESILQDIIDDRLFGVMATSGVLEDDAFYFTFVAGSGVIFPGGPSRLTAGKHQRAPVTLLHQSMALSRNMRRDIWDVPSTWPKRKANR